MARIKNIGHTLPLCAGVALLSIIVLMTGPQLVVTLKSLPSDVNMNEIYFKALHLNDFVFTEHVLQEVSARSRIDCGKKCVETEGCVMCTFHSSPEAPPGLCRLHSQEKNLTNGRKHTPGARSVVCSRPCAEGYELSCCHCLKAVNRKVNYATARDNCNQMQAHLVMPKSTAQAACMWSFLRARDSGNTWVGADDLTSPGVFQWHDGTPLPDSSSLWCQEYFDPHHGSVGDDCVAFTKGYPSLHDNACGNGYSYLCQRD